MAASPEFLAFLQDQFEQFGHVATRRMFGGTGLFYDGIMFAIVVRDTLYLKTNQRSRSKFEARGMGPFRYVRRGKPVSLDYHEIPADVLEDADMLAEWALTAFEIALAAKKRTGRKSAGP